MAIKPTLFKPDGYRLLHEGALACSAVEHAGIKVDIDYLHSTRKRIADEITEREDSIQSSPIWIAWKKRYGHSANLNSLDQMGVVLFEIVGLNSEGVRLTAKAQKYQLDEDALTRIDHPFCRDFLKIKKLQKIKSVYIEGILREAVDGFIHPRINLHIAKTYRSSYEQPNFQNIPIRNKEMGKMIRSAFIPRAEDRIIVEIDYKTLEVRIAYCYHKDPVMRKYLTDPNTNMHRDEAINLFKLKPEQIGDKTTRDAAKNQFVFPQFYGSVWFQCAPAIWERMIRSEWKVEGTNSLVIDHLKKHGIKKLGNCDPDWIRDNGGPEPRTWSAHVRNCERAMWDKYSTYARWKKNWYNEYEQKGYFWGFTGFGWEGVLKRNDVTNYPVQSAAFHCLLQSLIEIQKRLSKRKMKSLIIGQIHDSMILDVVLKEKDEVLAICKEVMTNWLLKKWSWITIPLDIDAEAAPPGASWHFKEKVKL